MPSIRVRSHRYPRLRVPIPPSHPVRHFTLMTTVTGEPPVLRGPSIVGFGSPEAAQSRCRG
jgi:hypothetical protein